LGEPGHSPPEASAAIIFAGSSQDFTALYFILCADEPIPPYLRRE